MSDKEVKENEEQTIKLDQFLKWQGIVATGGAAKLLIQGGGVTVNGEVETRRSRKLRAGDEIGIGEDIYEIDTE